MFRAILRVLALSFILTASITVIAQVAFEKPDYDFRTGPTVALDLNGDGVTDFATAVNGAVIITLNPGDGSVGAGNEFPAGDNPIVMIAGDFNTDGIPDLAELSSDGTVTVLLGNGDGTFSSPISTATGATNVRASISANDFNGDGLGDVAFVTRDGNVFVLLGNGDGSFRVSSFASGDSALAGLDSADYDGDGKIDLAILACCRGLLDEGDLQIMRGNGDGTFGSPTEVAPISGPILVTTADLNRDGHPDILVSFSDCFRNPCPGMQIYMNRGDGTFAFSQSLPTNFAPSLPAIGDFNGDGITDIAFQDEAAVLVYIGNGDGTFTFGNSYATGPRSFLTLTFATLVGDFNRDGVLDMATVNENGTLTMLPGNGDGTFFSSLRFRTGVLPFAAASADFNGDGIPDLVVSNSDMDAKSVSVLLGNGDGTFRPRSDFSLGNAHAFDLAVGDFNGDGRPDVAVVNNLFSNNVTIMLNDGSGSLSPRSTLTTGNHPFAVVVADFNGDGIMDLAVTNSADNTVSIFLGNGDGTFNPKMDFPAGSSPGRLVAADFNGDGIMDLAIANTVTDNSKITILLGNGDGSFRTANVMPTGNSPFSITAGDFNGDGITDLAWVLRAPNNAATIQITLGNGDGTFAPAREMLLLGNQGGTITNADINGDGVPDLVVVVTGLASPQSGDAVIFLGNGDGTFQGQIVVPAAGPNAFGLVADFDGNGLPDIAVIIPDKDAPAVSMLLNRSH